MNLALVTAGVHTAATTVREEDDACISSGRCRKGANVVNTDRHTGATGRGDGDDWLANCFSGCLTRLAFEAWSHSQFCAGFHIIQPIEAFKHFEVACDTEITGGINAAHGLVST